jgi:acyl phosphate:glycerol-3-phosphate acyltransferase
MLRVIPIIFAAYLVGSISFAVITSRVFRLPDPRSYGSGNPGATNVLRTGKKAAAALTLLGDAAKGWVTVLLAGKAVQAFALPAMAVDGAGLAVFLGHLYPVFHGFRGGKGVATGLGVLLALEPWLGVSCLATWLGVALILRISSLAALTAALFSPVYAWGFFGAALHTGTVAVIAVLLVWRHRSNIRSLVSGREERIGADSSGP